MKPLSALSPCWRKIIYWSAGLLLLYTLLGFFALPPLARSILAKQLAKELGRETSIGELTVNPYTLSATVRGLLIKDKDTEPLLSWKELHVNFQLSSFFGRSWNFKTFLLDTPHVRTELRADGSWNFSDLLNRTNTPPAEPDPGPPPTVRVGTLRIQNGTVAFSDLSKDTHFKTVIGPYQIALNNLDTTAGNLNDHRFEAATAAGEQLTWQGSVSFEPLQASGSLSLSNLALTHYAPYYKDQLHGEIRDGIASFSGQYLALFSPDTSMLRVTNCAFMLASLIIGEPGNSANVVQLPEFAIAQARADLFERKIELGNISTDNGHIDIERSPEGALNLARLFSPPPPTAAHPPPPTTGDATNSGWTTTIDRFELAGYSFHIADQTTPRPVALHLDQVSLQVDHLSTRPGSSADLSLSLQWNTNGTVKTQGTLELFPPRAELGLELAGIRLQPLDRYLDPILNLLILDGQIGLDGRLTLASPADAPPGFHFKGNLNLTDLAAAENNGNQFLQWASLSVGGIDLSLEQTAVDSIALDGLQLQVFRDQTNINLASLVRDAPKPAENSTASSKPAANAATPRVTIGTVTLSNAGITLADHSNPTPAHLAMDALSLQLTNISNQPGTEIGLSWSTRLNTNGTVAGQGKLVLLPLAVDLDLELGQIALNTFNPYLDPMLNLLVTSGVLDVDGKAALLLRSNAPPAASFKGNISIQDMKTRNPTAEEDLVQWKSLRLQGLDFQLEPTVVAINEIGLSDIDLQFVLRTNGNNFTSLSKQPPAPKSTNLPPAAATAERPAPTISVNRFTLANANLAFTDHSTTPPANLSIDELTGSISNISSEEIGSGEIDLKGKVGDTAPFELSGHFDLLTNQKDTDLALRLEKIALHPFEPYVAKYLGYKLEEGELNIDIKTRIEGRDLASDNVVTIDRFTLGEPVDSPDAVKAPVKLGIALLKDSRGWIELDVPVKGNLDDPEFRYAKVVWRTLVNLFVKAAASPFALLGRIAGGKDSPDLSYLEFKPGTDEPAEPAKLATLAKALHSRPNLHLEIIGRFDPTRDETALRQQKLKEQLRAKRPASPPEPTNAAIPEGSELSQMDYTNAVRKAFLVLTGASLSPTNTPPPVQVEPAPELPKPGPIRPSRRTRSGGEQLLWLGRRAPRPAPAHSADPIPAPETTTADLTPDDAVIPTPAVPFIDMEKRLMEDIELGPADLQDLAAARANRVRTHLTTQGMLEEARLSIVQPAEEQETNKATRVYFNLR